MIVVVGSCHDPTARSLVDSWPNAALCSAEDLTRPGWVWSSSATCTWIVDGNPVSDESVSGVFLRRSTVYPEELKSTHPEDRSYLAAELHAFLVFVLATTRATVVNPVLDGGLGDEALRPERWMSAAAASGLALAPLRLASRTIRNPTQKIKSIEVVGTRLLGDVPAATARAIQAVASRLGLLWSTFLLNGRFHLVNVTCTKSPSPAAVQALGQMLSQPRGT